MDFFAGLPILVTSLVALLLLNWLRNERQYFEQDSKSGQGDNAAPPVTDQLTRTMRWLQRIIICALVFAPVLMIFSGQLDANGVAEAFDGNLQFIAPFASAVFSAAVFRLLILAVVVVYVAHTRLLGRFRPTRERKEFW